MKENNLAWNFSHNLKKYRKKFNLTQSRLGNILGYTEKAIAKWESGNTLPSVRAIAELAKNFQIKIDDLLVSPYGKYILGIDGGGTKTHYMLCDEKKSLSTNLLEWDVILMMLE